MPQRDEGMGNDHACNRGEIWVLSSEASSDADRGAHAAEAVLMKFFIRISLIGIAAGCIGMYSNSWQLYIAVFTFGWALIWDS